MLRKIFWMFVKHGIVGFLYGGNSKWRIWDTKDYKSCTVKEIDGISLICVMDFQAEMILVKGSW